MRPRRAQDWDITRAYEAISSSGAVMPWADAYMVIQAFWDSQSRALDELTKLLPSMPDVWDFAPSFSLGDEYDNGLDIGTWDMDASMEQILSDEEKGWETIWLNGAKFEGVYTAVLVYGVTPEHELWEDRGRLPNLASFSIDWDIRRNTVKLEMNCSPCYCLSDVPGLGHNCLGLDCTVVYESSFTPSRHAEEVIFSIGSFLKAHHAKHGWYDPR